MNQRFLNSSLLVACTALTACGGGGGSQGGTPAISPAPPVISFNHVFPQGDATAAGGTAWDIVGVKTTLSGEAGDDAGQLYDTLQVAVTFAQDVSNALPAPGTFLLAGNNLGIGVSLDIDANSSTGGYETCDVASHVTPFEYVVDPGLGFGRLTDGNYTISSTGGPIYSGGANPPEEAVTSVTGHIITQSFFLPAVHVASGSSVPRVGVEVTALNGLVGVTDCVPAGNAEVYTDHQ